MRKRHVFLLLISAFFLIFASFAAQESGAQTSQIPDVKHMKITGEIAMGYNGYIIRGKKPSEVFTILNPDPKILDEYVKNSKIVQIKARIVSGDNVKIEMIDGKPYPQEGS